MPPLQQQQAQARVSSQPRIQVQLRVQHRSPLLLMLVLALCFCMMRLQVLDGMGLNGFVFVSAELSPRWQERVMPPEGCTAIVVGRDGSVDGAMTTHTNDCKDCDFRLSRVPRRRYQVKTNYINNNKIEKSNPSNETNINPLRPVVPSRFAYPRYVGFDRGDALLPQDVEETIHAWSTTQPIGYVEQVNETYSYIDGSYGIMNEFGVAMGESTCAAKFVAVPVYAGGKALFDVSELMRIAFERAKTAREAIHIMGHLAERYGYYGAEWEGDDAIGEAGEALTVTDANESWMFHICPDDTGSSAVWVAQRVPSNHIAAVANTFVIKEVDCEDSAQFLCSSNIYAVAERSKLWKKGKEKFNFAEIYGALVAFDEYCSRRVWRVFTLAAPSLNSSLSPYAGSSELPFSVPVDSPLSVHDLMRFQRDHYEGTEFDMTKGLAAGPYGNPNRYDRNAVPGAALPVIMQGTFERAISLFRTSYSFVTQSRSEDSKLHNNTVSLPIELRNRLWFGPSSPHATFYAPLYLHSHNLPEVYSTGSLHSYSRSSAWWAVTSISNWMEKMYCHIQPEVAKQQELTEKYLDKLSTKLEAQIMSSIQEKKQSVEIGSLLQTWQNEVLTQRATAWWNLFETLLVRYHDGYRIEDIHAETINPIALFYPKEWLIAVGFFPKNVDWNATTWSNTPHTIAKKSDSSTNDVESSDSSYSSLPNADGWSNFAVVIMFIGGCFVGCVLQGCYHRVSRKNIYEYDVIHDREV